MTGFENFILVFGGLIICILSGMNTPSKKNPCKRIPRHRQRTVPTDKIKHRELNVSKAIPIVSSTKKDAISGLRSLGFDKETATQRISKMPDGMPLEEMIKRGLSI